MSIGSALVGVALVLVVGAYLARPFRRAEVDLERAIEAWVAQVRAEGQRLALSGLEGSRGAEEAVNFCPQCGRRVIPDHRFCPGCGTRLERGEE